MGVPRLHRSPLVRRGERRQNRVAGIDIGEIALDDLLFVPLGAPAEVPAHRVDRLPAGRPEDGGAAALCLGSKSLKLYLATYRNEGVFCEALAVKIRDDVAAALELPAEKVTVALTQKARGGITITAST